MSTSMYSVYLLMLHYGPSFCCRGKLAFRFAWIFVLSFDMCASSAPKCANDGWVAEKTC